MNDPYADVDWDAVSRLHSVNHVHTFSANPGADDWEVVTDHQDGVETFQSLYDRGIRHFALSNYHPAKPTYPLSDYFEDVPDDALGCPNAEHHAEGVPGHYCSVGSDVRTGDGYDGTWQELFDAILDRLVCEDGGGIVINHPKRTGLSRSALLERLDYDDRVLGVEAYNHRSEHKPKYGATGDAIDVWDDLLATGRQVYGFFNPDTHSVWDTEPWEDETLGRNVLIVPEATEEAAARAYRHGHCYGAFRGSGLEFERIDAADGNLVVETDDDALIEFVSGGEVVASVRGRRATYDVRGDETYVRVEASDDTGERIFSQPIVYGSDAA